MVLFIIEIYDYYSESGWIMEMKREKLGGVSGRYIGKYVGGENEKHNGKYNPTIHFA